MMVSARSVGSLPSRTPTTFADDPRRRYYRLTALGRGALSAEIVRLEGVVRDGRLRLGTVKPGRA